MHKVRKLDGGIGLAAPQVGIETRVIVIGMGSLQTEGTEEFSKAFFNPEITEFNEKQEYMVEGCLSYPGLFVKVKRPTEITFTYEDEDGTKFYDHLSGITARIVQHEIDHLDGITFDTKANRIHLQKAKKDRKLSGRYKKRNALDNVTEL
jgi:peptide deformylase